ncbi:MAG: molybdopterin-guanine dinucleotide biosynthesis protein MobB [Candidatus Ozemobacteraceae bacterium]
MHIIRILGASGSGKTTFIDGLIPLLSPLRVAVVKHTRQELDAPSPQKDTGKHLSAGARVSIGLGKESAEVFWRGFTPTFEQVIRLLDGQVDLVIVEGARDLDLPTILLGEIPVGAITSVLLLRLPQKPGSEMLEAAAKQIHAMLRPITLPS